jgi:hypothetical protein
MPDSDSDSSSEDVDLEGIDWADFPLSPNSLRTVEVLWEISHLRQRFNELSARFAQRNVIADNLVLEDVTASQAAYERMATLATAAGLVAESQTAAPPVPMAMPTMPTKKEPKQPTVTLVTALPPTNYNEQDETDGTVRTLAYVKVQRALLKYLEKHASDTLTEAQARKWTQAIAPDGRKKPTAVDALKFCYYMRSLGYDVYANIKDSMILLYVIEALEVSVLYWAQNIVTNKILSVDGEAPRASRGRRNAVMNVDDVLEFSQNARTQPQPARNADLVAAEADLQALLEEGAANPE